MIAPKCDKCHEELTEFGGILLSPPNKENKVDKFHLCVSCYQFIVNLKIIKIDQEDFFSS